MFWFVFGWRTWSLIYVNESHIKIIVILISYYKYKFALKKQQQKWKILNTTAKPLGLSAHLEGILPKCLIMKLYWVQHLNKKKNKKKQQIPAVGYSLNLHVIRRKFNKKLEQMLILKPFNVILIFPRK